MSLPWHPQSWLAKPYPVGYAYPDQPAVERAIAQLRALPPLVTSGEIERLKKDIALAQQGKRFLLQGGDCAETLSECTSDVITAKFKILLQMSLVLVFAGKKPVIRVGRLAGQYAKPRSSPTETRNGTTLPSYFGDLINRADFTPESRTPDPALMVRAYQHAGLTLNFMRSLISAGFADAHHPERWDLQFYNHAGLLGETRERYRRLTDRLAESFQFMEVVGERDYGQLTSVDFFTSHEGLNLHYEAAQTRQVPARAGHYNLTTHLPWIGERTRNLDGAHVEYFRGIANPVGIKIGPRIEPGEVIALLERLSPANEPGKIVLIPRMGSAKVRDALPPIVRAVAQSGRHALWVCDPMHGNALTTPGGIKTRSFDHILDELMGCWDVLVAGGAHLGGVHIELTGQDVTECIGGAGRLSESDLAKNYASLCDPRLNYEQSMELALAIAERMDARQAGR